MRGGAAGELVGSQVSSPRAVSVGGGDEIQRVSWWGHTSVLLGQ